MRYSLQQGVVRKIKNGIINTTLSAVLLVSGLGGSLPLFLTQKAAAASTSTVISGDTASFENDPGWIFNRDPGNTTPYEFTTQKHSTGTGSIYVQPISTNAPDKFIAEDFGQIPVPDLSSISYDYLIAGNGTAASANQFYLSVYANIDSSNNFYDCRFDYVPTAGSISSFSTASFSPTSTPAQVLRYRNSRIPTCPATLADMQAGSYMRMFSVNVGDTSASDAGLAGYLDNVVVNRISGTNAYDFEPAPSVTGQDFGVGFWTVANNGFTGINVGFRTDNFTHVDAIKVTLQKNGSDIVSNTASAALLNDINTNPGGVFDQNGEISTSFVTDGTLNDDYCGGSPCWNAGSHIWLVSEKPDTAAITVTQNGVDYPATLTNFSEASGTFDSVIPHDTTAPAVPTLYRPANDAVIRPGDATLNWNDVTDPSGPVTYNYQSSYEDTVNSNNNGFTNAIYHVSTGTASQIDATHSATHVYYWQVQACDSVGNCSNWSGPWKVTIDGVLPIVSDFRIDNQAAAYSSPIKVSTLASDNFGLKNVKFFVTAPEDRSGTLVCSGNGTHLVEALGTLNNGNGRYEASLDTSGLNGQFCVSVQAEDNAANHSAIMGRQLVTLDNTAPTANITYSNNNGNALTRDDVVATLTANENVQDISDWDRAGNSNVFTKTFEHNGTYSVTITDLAGNTATVNVQIKRIDRQAPTISGVSDGAILQGPVHLSIFDPSYEGYFGFNADHGLKINGTETKTTETSDHHFLVDISQDGTYTAVATDKAGNATTITFTVDNTAPVTTIDSYSGTNTTPTLTGTVDDPTANLTVAIDGGTPATATNNGDGTWSFTVPTALNTGPHTVTLVASDTAGNSYQTTANVTVVAPRASLTGLTASDGNGNSNQATGHQPTVTVTPNNDGQVLGASTENKSEVKGDTVELTTDTNKDTSKDSSNFLGLGWWWLLVLGALAAFLLFLFRRSDSDNKEA